MADSEDERLEGLWEEYRRPFDVFDDAALARWMAQTLGQINGRVWRLSHPLIGIYRIGALTARRRGLRIWKLAQVPLPYTEAPCCGAPLLPLVTRDILDHGLLCESCDEPAVPLADIPSEAREPLELWAKAYAEVHEVAHWDESRRRTFRNYDKVYDKAARDAETLLLRLANVILPPLLEVYPALVWEDHDECLDVRPDDVAA